MKHLVVVGASAGGIETLRTLAASLPRDFPAPICIVLHTSPASPGILPDILGRSGPLPAVTPRNGERLRPGTIYVAPPDHHLVIEPGILRVTKGPRENLFRPAIDPLFRSAAQVYGPKVIGVILTGNLDDGAAGLWTVRQMGGTAIVQDPDDAMFSSMPTSALHGVKVDHIVPIADLAPLLVHLTAAPEPAQPVRPADAVEVEVNIAKEQDPFQAGIERIAQPSKYACPDCHGVLLEIREGSRFRFRCHTGHAYSAQSLLSAIQGGVEDALWESMRAMHEGERLIRQMAEHLSATPHDDGQARLLRERARQLRTQSDAIREMLSTRDEVGATKP